MLPINKEDVKEFKKLLNRVLTSNGDVVCLLLEHYRQYGLEFHRIFLHSKCVLSLNGEVLLDVVSQLRKVSDSKFDLINRDLDFLGFLKEKYEEYQQVVTDLLHEYRISVEELFTFVEFLSVNLALTGKFDNTKFSGDIAQSQLEHIYDCYGLIIQTIRDHHIEFCDMMPIQIKQSIRFVMRVIARIKTISIIFDSICTESYRVTYKDGKWWLTDNPLYWNDLERYRDLNFIQGLDTMLDLETQISLLEEAGLLNLYEVNNGAIIDFSKQSAGLAKLQATKYYKTLYPIYGEVTKRIIYQYQSYEIKNLLDVYEKIVAYSHDLHDKALSSQRIDVKKLIKKLGRNEIKRELALGPNELGLLDLFAFDIKNDKNYNVNHMPLIRNGDVFYFSPARIIDMSQEKVIDKILSNRGKVVFPDSSSKGIVFENSVQNFFASQSITFGRVSRDNKRGIPEIDGVFVIDDYAFIYEAKADIKPETRAEAYDYLRDDLLTAQSQLDHRLELLINSREARTIIEEKLGFSLDGKKLAPFILSSHHYFAGYKEMKSNIMDTHYPIVDFITLRNMIQKCAVNYWRYSKVTKCYRKKEKVINSGEEIWNFLQNQFSNLENREIPIHQPLEEGIVFQICYPPSICDK